jgi:hypothetical protein
MLSLIFYFVSSPLGGLRETTFFLLRYAPNDNSGIGDMSRQRHYLDKARACADAAKEAHDPGERVELLQLSQRFILLAEYAARCQDHGWINSGPRHISLARFR